MAIKITGGSSAIIAETDNNNNFYVRLPGNNSDGNSVGGGSENGPAIFSEIDAGLITNDRLVISPEADDDYRLRVGHETILDDEIFNYTAQNTGKHNNSSTTLTYSYTTVGLLTNAASATTTTTGQNISTYANFPYLGSGQNMYCQFELSFSAQPVSNTLVDIGMFIKNASNPYNPTDGVSFRLTSAGLAGVISHNGTETTTSIFAFTYVNSTVYRFNIIINDKKTLFYINDILYGSITTPIGQAQPFMSSALPFALRHAIVGGAAGGVFQVTLRGYSVSSGGVNVSKTLGEIGNAIYGSYQGLSGGTMGSLSAYTNNTNPTAAVPTNTTLAANLPSGLGGQAWETFTLALTTDGILMSYQVPAGTVSIPGKRLKVTGVKLSAFVQTVLAGGPCNSTFTLNYGHTAVSLATAEAATTKARRVVLLPELTQTITAAQAVNTAISQPGGCVSIFPEPIYVNPAEFISISVKHIGTVGSSGTIAYNIQYIYSWE